MKRRDRGGNADMTTFEVSSAFEEGLNRERGQVDERKDWTREEWLKRKVFLEDLIDQEFAERPVDNVEVAYLKARLAIVYLEGQRRFGR